MNNSYQGFDASSYLEHYGVLGMKWGVRKNPQKALEKSNKKLKKLDKKVLKTESKIPKKQEKAMKSQAKANSAILFTGSKRRKAARKTTRVATSYMKLQKNKLKAKRWAESMDSVFKNTNIKNLDKEAVSIGKKYTKMKIDDILSSNTQIVEGLLKTSDRYRR